MKLEQRVKDWFTRESQPACPDYFVCLALQHKTLDYIAVVKEQPKQAVFVDAVPDYYSQQDTHEITDNKLYGLKSILAKSQRPGRTSKPKLPLSFSFKKAHTLYFSEEISEIETLKDSRYTVFCL